MLIMRRIKYNPQTSKKIKLITKTKIIDLGKIFLYLLIFYIFFSALHKVFSPDIKKRFMEILKSSFNLLASISVYSYIYISVILGFIISIAAFLLYFVIYFFYNTPLLSSGLIAIIIVIVGMIYYSFIKRVYFDGEPFNR